MLTATYSIVAIAAEQEQARGVLSRLQQYIQAAWKGLQNIDFAFLESAFGKLKQFDKFCRYRKLERHLIPALRGTSQDSDLLLTELDMLSAKASARLRSVGDQLSRLFDAGTYHAREICHSMDAYCRDVFVRLDKEDKELLPLAKRLLSVDDWFAIAAQFLSDDGAHGTKRRAVAPVIPPAPFASPAMHMQ